MTPAETAHQEALRRIRAAQDSGQHWLDLGDIQNLERIPEEIGELSELRVLGLGLDAYDPEREGWGWKNGRDFYRPLTNLGPLRGVKYLRELNISYTSISNLGPLSGLSALQTLDVSATQVSDLGPLGGLSELQMLDVSRTPLSDLGPLRRMSVLQTLDLRGVRVSDLAPLSGLITLQKLILDSSQVCDLGPLCGLIYLQELHASFTLVSDLGPLSNLGRLNTLIVSFTQIGDFGPLKNLSQMQILEADSTFVNDLSPLIELKKLKILDLSSTRVSEVGSLRGMSELQILRLKFTQVSDLAPLCSMRDLHTLDVRGAPISCLDVLRGMKALQELNVSSKKVADISSLYGLSMLQELYMRHSSVSDLRSLSGLSNLRKLDITGTQVSDLSPLRDLRNLQLLDITETKVSSLEPLRGLNALENLDVSVTKVVDFGPLSGLKNLKTLRAAYTDVCDLGPLRGLEGLRELNVACTRVSDLRPLAENTLLQTLSAYGLKCLCPAHYIVEVLPDLEFLRLENMIGVPPEVLSENAFSDCLESFRSWWKDLQCGEEPDQEIKIFVLGNGTAGKTQICRQLRGEKYDEKVPSTHGVQIDILDLLPDKGKGAVKARLWDFGGQDIYHGTHALFLEGRAVFILVWTPRLDGKGDYEENGLRMHHHGLVYWLDYVRSLAGEDAALVVVQSQCDLESDRASAPLPSAHGFKRTPPQVTCSAKEGEMDELVAALRSASRYLLEVHGSYRLPTSWAAVRDRLRELKATEKTLSRDRHDELCRDNHGPSNPAAVLNYLHRCGELFYREGLFRDEIVLDQEWAVRAIYAVLDRKGPCQTLHAMGGVFTLPLLESLVWHDQFTPAEQQTLLGMMESCAICFPLDELTYKKDEDRLRRYALPDFLPLEKDVTARVEALWRADVPAQKITLEYAFLHEGILRQLLCQIGTLGGANAAYWKYGCCFYDAATHSRARIRSEKHATPETPAKGRIIIETCEGQAGELLARLKKAVLEIRIGQLPQVVEEDKPSEPAATHEDFKPLAETLKIEPAPLDPTAKPQVWLSYGWGVSDEMVNRLEKRLLEVGYDVRRDASSLKVGRSILDFEREVGRGARVIAIISTKYLESFHCMRELVFMYQHSQGSEAHFLNRVVPLILEDVKIKDDEQRLDYVAFWVNKYQSQADKMKGLPMEALGSSPGSLALMQQFYQSAQPILTWLADVLMPRGIKNIEANNFAAVLDALKAKT